MTDPTPTPSAGLLTRRLGMAVSVEEEEALATIARLWPSKYLGKSSVLRDYTPSQAVDFVKRLNATMAAA